MALALILRGKGRIEILPQDDDALETILLRAALLRLLDLLLKGRRGRVAFFRLGENEAEGDELVRVVHSQQVVPVLLIETRHRGKDQDMLAVLDRVRRDGDMIKVVFRDGRRPKLGPRPSAGLLVR